jgi:hypothetical protein
MPVLLAITAMVSFEVVREQACSPLCLQDSFRQTAVMIVGI